MAAIASRQCPGWKGLFIKGIRFSVSINRLSCEELAWLPVFSPLRERTPSGFSASAGIAQDFPNFWIPGMRPCSQSCCTARMERPHFFADSFTVRYSMAFFPPGAFNIFNYMRDCALFQVYFSERFPRGKRKKAGIPPGPALIEIALPPLSRSSQLLENQVSLAAVFV